MAVTIMTSRITPRAGRWAFAAAAVAGAALVEASAAIHLHLWAEGYKHVPTIGPLFLAQGVAGVVLGLATAARRGLLLVAAGALYMVSSLGGFLLAATVGLFGFHDSLGVPYAGMTVAVEIAGAVVMGAAAAVVVFSRLRASSSVRRGAPR